MCLVYRAWMCILICSFILIRYTYDPSFVIEKDNRDLLDTKIFFEERLFRCSDNSRVVHPDSVLFMAYEQIWVTDANAVTVPDGVPG